MFKDIKDRLGSAAAKSLVSSKLGRYGKLLDLRIRSSEKMIFAEVLLEGETESILIEVSSYRILPQENGYAMVVDRVNCSRAWLKHLLEDFLVGVPLPVPTVALLALGRS